MGHFTKISGQVVALAALLVFGAVPSHAETPAAVSVTPAPAPLPDRVLGKADAPVKVDEYVSLTCSHCAEFYNDVLPELEKRYVDTGKVRFVLHDFAMDGVGLKAAQLARCMPADEFFPFIKVIYQNQASWMGTGTPEKTLVSYASLGGLPEDKAEECLKDTKLQDQIVAERDEAAKKYSVDATPTFVINDGVQIMRGVGTVNDFAKVFDQMLAAKH